MMNNIAFLGLGAMGSRMVKHLSTHEGRIKVWNRTPLQHSFEGSIDMTSDLFAAVKDADVVFAMIRDDLVSRSLWLDPDQGVLNHLKPEAMVVECSTLSPQWVMELSEICVDRGLAFVEAPVIGSRPQAEAAALIQLVGAQASNVEKVLPLLSLWSKEVIHVGAVSCAARIKLVINTLLGIQVAGIAELLGYANQHDINLTEVLDIINKTVVASPVMINSAQSMINRMFDPMFPVELIHKDLGYLVASAAETGASMPVSKSIQSVFKHALDQGLGEQNMSSVAQLFIDDEQD